MIDRDGLFLATLDDLEPRIERGRPAYDVLMISGLLRKLLLDAEPLVDQVNRPESRRLKIRFRANASRRAWPPGLEPTFWAIEDGFDPETSFRPQPIELTRGDLLSSVVMFNRGREISVKDAILFAANVGGAVHAGQPRGEGQESLADAAQRYAIGGYPAGLSTLLAIGRVVVRGLDPLRRHVQRDLGLTAASER